MYEDLKKDKDEMEYLLNEMDKLVEGLKKFDESRLVVNFKDPNTGIERILGLHVDKDKMRNIVKEDLHAQLNEVKKEIQDRADVLCEDIELYIHAGNFG